MTDFKNVHNTLQETVGRDNFRFHVGYKLIDLTWTVDDVYARMNKAHQDTIHIFWTL
jgi:hypothetical protein